MMSIFRNSSPTLYCVCRFCPVRAMAALAGLSVLLGLPALAAPRNGPAVGNNESPIAKYGCIAASLDLAGFPETVGLMAVQKKQRRPIADAESQRPMTEQEIDLLIRALRPLELKDGQGRAITAVIEGTDLTRERMGVLVGDVVSLLAQLDGQDALDRLKKNPGTKEEVRARAENAFTTIRSCAIARFAQRGGERVYLESMRIVEKRRPDLERVLLEGVSLKPATERKSVPMGISAPMMFEDCRPFGSLACPESRTKEKIPLLVCKRAGEGVTLVTPALLAPASGSAENATLEVSQDLLNQLVGRLGALSDAGIYPSNVPWQWWVTDARFTLMEGSMTFTATVRSLVGNQTNAEPRTVPVSVSLVSATEPPAAVHPVGRIGRQSQGQHIIDLLRINIGAFTVPISAPGQPAGIITQVDVAKLYSFSIPIEPQNLSVPMPDGGTQTVTSRITNITPQYLAGKILISFDVGLN
jgi:hypothetical protein